MPWYTRYRPYNNMDIMVDRSRLLWISITYIYQTTIQAQIYTLNQTGQTHDDAIKWNNFPRH